MVTGLLTPGVASKQRSILIYSDLLWIKRIHSAQCGVWLAEFYLEPQLFIILELSSFFRGSFRFWRIFEWKRMIDCA